MCWYFHLFGNEMKEPKQLDKRKKFSHASGLLNIVCVGSDCELLQLMGRFGCLQQEMLYCAG